VILWRISNHELLSGDGALRASGRWHTRGRRVVYCAQSPAAALLEILVHYEIDVRDLPTRYRLLKVAGPDDFVVEQVSPGTLPTDWRIRTNVTRMIGDTWLGDRASALLQVPSAVVPETTNVLLNPEHPDAARLSIVQVSDHVLDPRLLK
jgi:RES domain-containing protein